MEACSFLSSSVCVIYGTDTFRHSTDSVYFFIFQNSTAVNFFTYDKPKTNIPLIGIALYNTTHIKVVPWRINITVPYSASQTVWAERVKWKNRKVHLFICPTLQISGRTVGPYMTDGSCVIVPRWGYCGAFWHSNQINLISFLSSFIRVCVCV